MAEKKQPDKEAKPSEPTERVILAGFEMDPAKVAAALVDAGYGQTATAPLAADDKDRRQKLIDQALKTLAPAEGGAATVYVEIGVAANGDKRKAIEACVGEGTLGTYRAPSRKAWKDGVRKRPPVEIAPDVETLA
jgi:hypothetical protein